MHPAGAAQNGVFTELFVHRLGQEGVDEGRPFLSGSDVIEPVQGSLPAVSYVKPSGWVDRHPASSKWDLFEGFVKKIVEDLQSNSELWNSTAIFITTDEGGGYYDSGYVQPVDFFGDGTRIPLIIVSPFTQGGHLNHSYGDHVSITKFIERNWNLGTLSSRSRDNDPNPVVSSSDPYVPLNSPAIDDLFSVFRFSSSSH